MPASRTAIILSAFGTSTEARSTYALFEAQARERFPGHDILWAYTSRTLRKNMVREGVRWTGPEELLAELPRRGYANAVLQSLHIVPGREYGKLCAAAARSPVPVALGAPLLCDAGDCDSAAAALEVDFGDPARCMTVVVGHGSPERRAQSLYRLFYERLRARHPEGVLLSMIEGEPSWSLAREAICRSGMREVRFVPLMFVAGEHLSGDVLGATDSWASQLSGFRCTAAMRGAGLNRDIAKIFFRHLQEALNGV